MTRDGKLRFDCLVTGNILSPSNGVGLSCKVIDGIDDAGTINVTYKRVNGENKIDLDVDKELIFKIASDAVDIDRLIGKIGSFLG